MNIYLKLKSSNRIMRIFPIIRVRALSMQVRDTVISFTFLFGIGMSLRKTLIVHVGFQIKLDSSPLSFMRSTDMIATNGVVVVVYVKIEFPVSCGQQ